MTDPYRPPPPGPGARPPFVAAPVEGRQGRTWLGLGIAGGLLALCCVVCGVAGGAVLLLSGQVANEQARAAAGDYLTALVEEDWRRAYELRCRADRQGESLAEYTRRVSGPPDISSYELGDVQTGGGDDPFDPAAPRWSVPADVTYDDGDRAVLTVPLRQNPQTGQFEVCGRVTGG